MDQPTLAICGGAKQGRAAVVGTLVVWIALHYIAAILPWNRVPGAPRIGG